VWAWTYPVTANVAARVIAVCIVCILYAASFRYMTASITNGNHFIVPSKVWKEDWRKPSAPLHIHGQPKGICGFYRKLLRDS
jgi:hypothetical protein